MLEYNGFSASSGIVFGKVIPLIYEQVVFKDYVNELEKKNEILKFENLIDSYSNESVLNLGYEENSKLLNVHKELIYDPYLKNTVINKIDKESKSLFKAIEETFFEICMELNKLESEYMRDRIYDYISIQEEFFQKLSDKEDRLIFEDKFILAVENLSPKIINKYKDKLIGIISINGGKTSHASLYAKNLSIPYLICDSLDIKYFEKNNCECILDCISEKLILNPDSYTIEKYKNSFSSSVVGYLDLNIAKTKNNKFIKVCSNISSFDEFEISLSNGTDGCGLFRTEFLYMSDDVPTEEYQFEIFKTLAESTKKSITIRTFDIGADKKSKYFSIDDEKNPFLGLRGFRVYKEFYKELRKHLRAILRASAFGNLKIMIPMITTLDEILWIKNEISKIKDELKEENIPFNEEINFGIMVETPASAFLFDILVSEIDFVSIGTNDLAQYMLACDRENSRIQKLYNCYNPAIIRTISDVCNIAHKNGKKVSICGNFASEVDAISLLILLGVDEFSVTNDVLQNVKRKIRMFDINNYIDFYDKFKKFKTTREVLNYFDSK